MCHKCRGGAGKETKSIIASTKTRAFLDGQRCGSALQGPKLLRHHNPGDYRTHSDQHIDLLPCTKRGMDRTPKGQLESRTTIIVAFHIALYGSDTWT